MARENAAVVAAMRLEWPTTTDWEVEGSVVSAVDKDDRVLGTMPLDDLTRMFP